MTVIVKHKSPLTVPDGVRRRAGFNLATTWNSRLPVVW